MKAVRREDTAAELHLRRALWRAGLRYRIHLPTAGTKPDVVFTRARVAIFVDGCFWHGCPIHYKAPVNNAEFWRKRLLSNQNRDARDTLRLERAGWTVMRFWECDVRRETERVVASIRAEAA
jgi:DNA mismatch endonuclease (patch repair protein)